MKCFKCKENQEEVVCLSDYSRIRLGVKDSRDYCEPCFDDKYPELIRKEDEESNN